MLLDEATNDLVRAGGSFVRVSDLPETKQHVNTRLRIFRGEVFLDVEIGVDFFEEILRKQINPAIQACRASQNTNKVMLQYR